MPTPAATWIPDAENPIPMVSLERRSGEAGTAARLVKLTPAERSVLRLIARNMTSQQIAESIGVSPKTVENQRSSICRKLEITGNNALLRFVVRCNALKIELCVAFLCMFPNTMFG